MSIEKLEVYKCKHCGNIVNVLRGGGPIPACCNEEMKLQKENTTEAATEKHIPVVETIPGGYKVTVGSVAHPMGNDHFIEWIELIADGIWVYRKDLKPGDIPQAEFKIEAASITARAYCNLHGLWKS
jgi:superoxide reductase